MTMTISINPNPKEIEEFGRDLTWLRDQVSEKAHTLVGKQGRDFKLSAIQGMYSIWDEGKKKKILKDMEIPRLQFDEDNHTFEVMFRLVQFDFECRMEITLRKQWGKWGIRSS